MWSAWAIQGNEYARTRHNVGFDVIDVIGEKQNIRLTKNAMHGLIGEGFVGGESSCSSSRRRL